MRSAIAVSLLLAALPAAAKTTVAEVGKPAPDFTATDSLGKTRTLSQYKGKTVVLEWLNYGCPFVKKQYNTKSMQTLQKEYGDKGVVWMSVISSAKGKQGNYPPEEINKMNAERGGKAAAILLDYDGTVGKLYDARTTPDMFVIDPKGTLVYSGAVDDTPTTDVDEAPGENYVREALDAVLSGKPVETSYTKSYGCGVKYR